MLFLASISDCKPLKKEKNCVRRYQWLPWSVPEWSHMQGECRFLFYFIFLAYSTPAAVQSWGMRVGLSVDDNCGSDFLEVFVSQQSINSSPSFFPKGNECVFLLWFLSSSHCVQFCSVWSVLDLLCWSVPASKWILSMKKNFTE